MSLKQLHRQTDSIVDYSVFVTKNNVEAITMRILEDMIDVVLECGFDSPQQAYEKINETSDLISWVQDFGSICSDDEISVDEHQSHIFEHLCNLCDSQEPEITEEALAAGVQKWIDRGSPTRPE